MRYIAFCIYVIVPIDLASTVFSSYPLTLEIRSLSFPVR
jgi:hypothetical protein